MMGDKHAEDANFCLEGMAYPTVTLSWMETDEHGIRWERVQTITAAGVLNAMRREIPQTEEA